ncbi:MAG: hypothetical protein ACK5Q5_13830 [Planctomycetaceae bacterium]
MSTSRPFHTTTRRTLIATTGGALVGAGLLVSMFFWPSLWEGAGLPQATAGVTFVGTLLALFTAVVMLVADPLLHGAGEMRSAVWLLSLAGSLFVAIVLLALLYIVLVAAIAYV